MKNIIKKILPIGVILFLGIGLYTKSDNYSNQKFSVSLKLDENILKEGEDVYLTISIKNNSNKIDSIKDLGAFKIIESLNITNSKGAKCDPIKLEYSRLNDFYMIFNPNEEIKFKFPLIFACSFAGLTSNFRYYPKDNYKIKFVYTNEDSLSLISNEIEFEVVKNSGRNEELFHKIRSIDTLVKNKYPNPKLDFEIIDRIDSLINLYSGERLLENLILESNLYKIALGYKTGEEFIQLNIKRIKDNPYLRNKSLIIGNCLSQIASYNKYNIESKYDEFRTTLENELLFNSDLKIDVLNIVDSLIALRSKN